MQPGSDVDIITGLPIEKLTAGRETANQETLEARLKNQSKYFEITKTEAGNLLVELITRKLIQRIAYLVSNDPEAKAYSQILQDLNVRQSIAETAVKKLYALKTE